MLKAKLVLLKYKVYYKNFIKKNWISLKSGQNFLQVGSIGLLTAEACKLQLFQLNVIARNVLRFQKGKVLKWFPNRSFRIPLTKKSLRSRMGKGKGKLSVWCSNFLKGVFLAEFEFVFSYLTSRTFAQLRNKLPVRVQFVRRLGWRF